MQYAFMTFSTPQLTLPQCLTLASTLGYDAIEPRIDSDHAHGIQVQTPASQRAELRRQLDDAPVRVGCLATSVRFADPQIARDFGVDHARRSIDLAGDLGVPCLRIFGGVAGEGLSEAQAFDRVADALSAIADDAAQRDVTLCVETHDQWSDPARMARLMSRLDHPAVAVTWDFLHPQRHGFGSPAESFAILKPWIRHAHFHDALIDGDQLTLMPIGEGEVDHRIAIELLLDANYDGCFSGEWTRPRSKPAEQYLADDLAVLRRYETECSTTKANP